MKIAKIVSSNSHLDYVARVIDALDVENPPSSEDYYFGQFVDIDIEKGKIVGVIYDSQIVNPEYSNYGPRLSPKPTLGTFSPDFLNEQGILLGVLLLGMLDENGSSQGVPTTVVPSGQDVSNLDGEDVKRFHADANGSVRVHYYPQIVANAGSLAVPLLNSIVDRLSADCSEDDRQRLNVLRRSFAWQGTFGGMKF
jgi:hypothetical protein